MTRLRDVYAKVQTCHRYSSVSRGRIFVPHAYKCSHIVRAIRSFIRQNHVRHERYSERELITKVGQDFIAMKLIKIVIPSAKS